MRRGIKLLGLAILWASVETAWQPGLAADWPQWRGPRQDGISQETGLLSKWPDNGPVELWRVPLGSGYSAVSVVGSRAYTMFGSPEGEFAVCLDAANGKTLWKTRCGDLFKESSDIGPRATPTIAAGNVYVLSGTGSLQCLEAATGKPVWGYGLLEKFGGETPTYGFSASPAVFGDLLVVVSGARNGKSLVGLDKQTGAVVWTSLDDKIGYSTPIRVEVGDVSQLIVLMGEALVGVSIKDGKELWRHEWKTTEDANVATPICHGNRLYISTGYGTGCGLFELSVKDGKPAADLVWSNKEMKNYFSSCVLVDGYLYGFNNTMLTCMDFKTGESKWKQRGFNRGSLLAADGKLIIYGERATLALAQASSEEYKELAKATVLDDKTWTMPTLADGRLFVRNEKELVCLQVK
jgi:outer membrane protein assembly factor BamB